MMRRIVFVGLFFIISFGLIAQTQQEESIEVFGVETRWANMGSGNQNAWGFEFRNMNNFRVTVVAELVQRSSGYGNLPPEEVTNTKNLVLEPGEEFVWELGFSNFSPIHGAEAYGRQFFVRFRAFRFL